MNFNKAYERAKHLYNEKHDTSISDSEVARRLGTTRQAVLEKKKGKSPSIETVKKFCDVLEIDLNTFYRFGEERE